jgi:hypothetical protein
MMLVLTKLLSLLLLLLLSGSQEALASPTPNSSPSESSSSLSRRQATTGKYCNPSTQICYLEYSWGPSIPVFRIAVPDSATTNTPFDTLLQIVSPVSLGWAGFSWGGGMTLNPLTVVWPNGNGATVSSRWATYVLFFLTSLSPPRFLPPLPLSFSTPSHPPYHLVTDC